MSGSSGRAPTRGELERIAGALITSEGLIEKDWNVVRALQVLASLRWGEDRTTRLIFAGGTSLSKGWGLISRFSEDIDFRVWSDTDDVPRAMRKEIRDHVIKALSAIGFVEDESARLVGRDSRFIRAHFGYNPTMRVPDGLRSDIKVEITMERPRLTPVAKPIRSFVGQSRNYKPEVPSILCLDPVETAAEKLSAFAWRALARDRSQENNDPSVVRHLYDLATLHDKVTEAWPFRALALEVLRGDANRGKDERPRAPDEVLDAVAKRITEDPAWKEEYQLYIHEVGYGPRENMFDFEKAAGVLERYIRLVRAAPSLKHQI